MDSGIPKSVRTGLAALALVVATVGLAYAAGDLPDKASDKATAAQEDKDDVGAERKAGSTGPEDGENESSSEDVHEVIDDRDGGGCEFGQAVAEAARGDQANEDAGAEDPCDNEGNAGSDNDNAESKAARQDEQDDRKAAREAEQDERKAGSTGPSNDDSSSDDDELDDDSEDEDSDDDEPKEKDNNAGGAEQSEEARGDDHGKGNDE